MYVKDKSGCTAYAHTTDGGGACWLHDKDVAIAGAGGSLTNGNCYNRKAVTNAIIGGTGTNATWKTFYDYKVGAYKNAVDGYNSKLNANWSTYEIKGKPERKRLADVEQWKLERAKAKSVMDGYKSASVDTPKSNMDTAKGHRDTAYGKITDLAYYQAVDSRDKAKVVYDTAAAALKANADKIVRITAVMKHMKDAGNSDKGSLADLTKRKGDAD